MKDAPDLGRKPLNALTRFLADHISAVRFVSAASIVAMIGGLCATVARSGLHWDQETALYPWLMNHGWVLYRDIRDQHGPLFPSLMALLPDPGSSNTQFAFMLVLVSFTALLVAVSAWRVSGPVAAVIGLGLYALWILPFDGSHVWYDLGLSPFYLVAFLAGWELLKRRGSNWLPVVLGLLMGMSFSCKAAGCDRAPSRYRAHANSPCALGSSVPCSREFAGHYQRAGLLIRGCTGRLRVLGGDIQSVSDLRPGCFGTNPFGRLATLARNLCADAGTCCGPR